MINLQQLLTFEYKSAYESAYDLTVKKNYSTPKIYSANGDLSKRWYVYFSFRNPKTNKLKRVTPFYGIANKYKTKEERMEVLIAYRKAILKLLKKGYNPYQDNTELHKSLNSNKKQPTQQQEQQQEQQQQPNILKQKETIVENKTTIKEAFNFAIRHKEKQVNTTTIKSYKGRVKKFVSWLKEVYPNINYINQIDKKIILGFLNHVLTKTSVRNRNNYRTDLGSLFQTLEDNDIINQNIVKKTTALKTKPNRNKSYTEETQKNIFEYLKNEDPILLLFIKFISYNFLRPIEVCRLKVGDINLNNKTLQFKAKNSSLKTKIIPEILWNELPDLTKLDKNEYLFTPNKIGGNWEANEINKRDHFSKRFKKNVKNHFNLGAEYGLYSFRHTYITKLYRALIKGSSPFVAKSKLMLITGHTSMTALEKYLRDIDAHLPEDYSEMLKKSNE